VTPRAGGYSQSGQSVPLDGLTLDMSQLNRIGAPDAGAMSIDCEAGARWRDVIARCVTSGVLPAVVPLNLDLTVGGTVSAGGVGATSHTYGPVVGNVSELTAVTGSGTLARAMPGEDLFDAVAGGVGRCGVITSVRVRLRKAAPHVRTFCLAYESVAPWLADQQTLAAGGCTYLEAFCVATTVGSRVTPAGRRPAMIWSYIIHVSFEHEAGAAPEQLPELTGAHRLLYRDDDETSRFAARYDGRFAMMHRTGDGSRRIPGSNACFLSTRSRLFFHDCWNRALHSSATDIASL
jgi:cytokinin dehydrogenase